MYKFICILLHDSTYFFKKKSNAGRFALENSPKGLEADEVVGGFYKFPPLKELIILDEPSVCRMRHLLGDFRP